MEVVECIYYGTYFDGFLRDTENIIEMASIELRLSDV